MKKSLLLISTMLLCGMLYACGEEKGIEKEGEQLQQEAKKEVKAASANTQKFKDVLGNDITVGQDVEKIVTLSPEMLILLSDLGVEVAGTVDSQMRLPEEEGVQKVGGINEINMEQVIALAPDLVIGTPHFHAKLLPSMGQNNIPLALMQMTSFENVKQVARTYGEILHMEEAVEEKITEAQKKVEEVTAKVSGITNKKVVVLNVSPGGVSIQKEGTTALEVADLLGLENIAHNLPALPQSMNSAPFSMENLVDIQPDYIFLTIHGATEAGKGIIESELKGDAAWQTLDAVKNNQTHILPSELFLMSPGLRYHETVQYMADAIVW